MNAYQYQSTQMFKTRKLRSWRVWSYFLNFAIQPVPYKIFRYANVITPSWVCLRNMYFI